jgi:hypothetical protein
MRASHCRIGFRVCSFTRLPWQSCAQPLFGSTSPILIRERLAGLTAGIAPDRPTSRSRCTAQSRSSTCNPHRHDRQATGAVGHAARGVPEDSTRAFDGRQVATGSARSGLPLSRNRRRGGRHRRRRARSAPRTLSAGGGIVEPTDSEAAAHDVKRSVGERRLTEVTHASVAVGERVPPARDRAPVRAWLASSRGR